MEQEKKRVEENATRVGLYPKEVVELLEVLGALRSDVAELRKSSVRVELQLFDMCKAQEERLAVVGRGA
jgi:hypothetical protein